MGRVLVGDALEGLKTLAPKSMHCCVTSPPYWGLRDYGVPGQLGLEETPDEYTAKLVEVFREVHRVLVDSGTVWLNLGDSYVANSTGGLSNKPSLMTGGKKNQTEAAKRPSKTVDGLRPKNLVGIPWRVAFALQADGWCLRSDIVWEKPNAMPESVTDRPTRSHEYIFLLSKSPRYYYDHEAIKEDAVSQRPSGNGYYRPQQITKGGCGSSEKWLPTEKRNRRDVWRVATRPYKHAHFATFPPELIEPCILAGCPPGGTVLDPFLGSGTTAATALRLDRDYLGIELNREYEHLWKERIREAEMEVLLS